MSAVVVGASGGIGAALVSALLARGPVVALSRDGPAGLVAGADGALRGRIDVTDGASIAAAAALVSPHAPTLVLVATGTLQGPDGRGPERGWRELDAAALLHAYAVNAVGPALVAKHMLPLLPRTGRAVFAALSARVGSIGDNRLGGWHAYRASKAALDMLLRCLAIELARTRPDALCVGLHPGTVDTPLSRPFQTRVPAGQLFTPEVAASRLLAVLDGLGPGASGSVFDWAGALVPP